MFTAVLARPDDFDGWRAAARGLAAARVPGETIVWQVGDAATDLLGGEPAPPAAAPMFTVPKVFLEIARRVICHADPERFALLYAALTTLRDRPKLFDDAADPLVRRLYDLDKGVRRDVHKMRAFVRFRDVGSADGVRDVGSADGVRDVGSADGVRDVGSADGVRDVGSADGVRDVGSADGVRDVGSADGVRDVGSADGVRDVGSADGVRDVGSADGVRDVGSADGVRDVGSADGVRDVGSADGVRDVGSADGVREVGSADGVREVGSADGVREVGSADGVREVAEGDGRFVAWFEPEHHIVRLNAGFFARRFANMAWSILTPDECVHWDGELSFTPGATRADAPDGDPLEATWRTYYASIFNPARLKVKAMTAEMPKKYWRNLPEAALVPGLVAGAEERTRMMIAAGHTAGQSNDDIQAAAGGEHGDATTLPGLRAAAAGCRRCPLFGPATQTVFGEGPPDARLVFVGEQPGDQEDLAGRPFVGPAGQVFDRALAAAGIDRARTYVTNAVKHFKFEQRGKRRIHAKPDVSEIDACRWWVDHERALVRPAVTVALGATAARSLTGRAVTISRERGRPLTLADGSEAWITVHPSFLLRIEDRAAAEVEFDRFVADLAAVRERLAALAG